MKAAFQRKHKKEAIVKTLKVVMKIKSSLKNMAILKNKKLDGVQRGVGRSKYLWTPTPFS